MEWPDEKVMQILQALKPALRPGSRVLIQDFYLPEPGDCPLWQARRFRASDILTLAISNGGQREREEWPPLLARAGTGFRIKGVSSVSDSDVVFIEVEWRGE